MTKDQASWKVQIIDRTSTSRPKTFEEVEQFVDQWFLLREDEVLWRDSEKYSFEVDSENRQKDGSKLTLDSTWDCRSLWFDAISTLCKVHLGSRSRVSSAVSSEPYKDPSLSFYNIHVQNQLEPYTQFIRRQTKDSKSFFKKCGLIVLDVKPKEFKRNKCRRQNGISRISGIL